VYHGTTNHFRVDRLLIRVKEMSPSLYASFEPIATGKCGLVLAAVIERKSLWFNRIALAMENKHRIHPVG
jgi:hypothetical protein